MTKLPTPKPRPAPDGSVITPSMARANADYQADIKAGNITPDGQVIHDRGGMDMNNPTAGHTTSGLDAAMQAHADKLHPVKP